MDEANAKPVYFFGEPRNIESIFEISARDASIDSCALPMSI